MLVQTLTAACALTGTGLRRVPSPMMNAPTVPLTDSPAWSKVQGMLDAYPVFTLANENEKPLQYEVNGQPMAMFYADVDVAKDQLKAAKGQNPELKCDIQPFGLGAAYALSTQGKATLVPGIAELTAAGMPPGLSAVGQELPLFACMEMKRETEEGAELIPLFMSVDDCEEAVKEAREKDAALQISPLSLSSVVEHLSTLADDAQAFDFVAPSRSTTHISSYVGNGIYQRVVDE